MHHLVKMDKKGLKEYVDSKGLGYDMINIEEFEGHYVKEAAKHFVKSYEDQRKIIYQNMFKHITYFKEMG